MIFRGAAHTAQKFFFHSGNLHLSHIQLSGHIRPSPVLEIPHVDQLPLFGVQSSQQLFQQYPVMNFFIFISCPRDLIFQTDFFAVRRADRFVQGIDSGIGFHCHGGRSRYCIRPVRCE